MSRWVFPFVVCVAVLVTGCGSDNATPVYPQQAVVQPQPQYPQPPQQPFPQGQYPQGQYPQGQFPQQGMPGIQPTLGMPGGMNPGMMPPPSGMGMPPQQGMPPRF